MKTLAERLKDWTDWDVAEYHLGVVFGLFPEWTGSWGDEATAPYKGVIWNEELHYRWPTEREQQWLRFCNGLDADVRLTELQRLAFAETWQRLKSADVSYPTVVFSDPEDGGAIVLSWNPKGLTLEIEIAGDGSVSWFFCDHAAGVNDEGQSDDEWYAGWIKYAPRFARIEQ